MKTNHFTFRELVGSSTARINRIDNIPNEYEYLSLAALVTNILEPARSYWGCQLFVNSGYRSPELNKHVGGVPSSQHCKGEAADITTGSTQGNRKLCEWMRLNLNYDQLILEKGGKWIHVSYVIGGECRNQYLTT